MLERALFYTGFALIALGGLSLVYPLSSLRIRTRATALLVIAAGFLLVAIGAEVLDSYLVYLGFALFMAGLVSLIRPLRFLWIQNRPSALAIAAVGLLVSLGALFWPHGEKEAPPRRARLDDWMPRWQVDERHTLEVAAAPDKVFSAIRAVRADEILLFRTLIAIRRCGQSGGPESILNAPEEKPLLDVATQTTFVLLEDIGAPVSKSRTVSF
jgi:hypothetical protein